MTSKREISVEKWQNNNGKISISDKNLGWENISGATDAGCGWPPLRCVHSSLSMTTKNKSAEETTKQRSAE